MTNPQSKNAPGDFQDKVAIVTGAASGIGLATVNLLVARGASVIAQDINPAVHEVFQGHERVVPFVADVSREQAARDVVALATGRFCRLDILVNNAASIVYRPTVETTLAEWESIMGVTATGVFLHTREALKAMIPNRSGAIVNVGSYACYQTFPGIVAYAAAKGALAQITRTTALEAIEHGVRVNAVGSGDVVTNLLNTFREDGREFLEDHGAKAPIKRAARPEEIAEVIAFLASEKASFLVGSVVMADGGMSVAIS